jgi:glycerol-3-phosphate acyltransferase PlsY
MLENMVNDYLVGICILMYLIGSIPFAIVVSKAFSLPDPRSYGSNNPGATNVYRSGNKLAAGITLIGDFLKGYVPTALLFNFNLLSYEIYALALLILLGHIFPVTLKFKGGKGVATSLGIILALNYLIGISVILIWLIVFLISRVSGLSAIISFLFLPIIVVILKEHEFMLALSIINMITILLTHRKNIYEYILKKP